MIIMLPSSKTMRLPAPKAPDRYQEAELTVHTLQLQNYIQSLSVYEVAKAMKLSSALADKTHRLIQKWTHQPEWQYPALDSFLGDVYSGLQAQLWSTTDRYYANEHLRIISGLYGILRPLDGVYPYRLEMGYKFPETDFVNLYKFWGSTIANTIPKGEIIINLAAAEYSKVVTDFIDPSRIINPIFLTVGPKTGEPTFVVVHSKIARGAYANWMIKQRICDVSQLRTFADLGYVFNPELSTEQQPTFVCKKFGGLGLSVRKNSYPISN